MEFPLTFRAPSLLVCHAGSNIYSLSMSSHFCVPVFLEGCLPCLVRLPFQWEGFDQFRTSNMAYFTLALPDMDFPTEDPIVVVFTILASRYFPPNLG